MLYTFEKVILNFVILVIVFIWISEVAQEEARSQMHKELDKIVGFSRTN